MLSLLYFPNEAKAATTERIWGANRYDTMTAAVQEGFTSNNLVGGCCHRAKLSRRFGRKRLGGSSSLPCYSYRWSPTFAQAKGELLRLGVTNVHVTGGPNAVSDAVVLSIKELGITADRVAGSNRVSTSLKAFARVREAGSTSDTVIVVTSRGFADALSVGPWAWASASPVLLTQSNGELTSDEVEAVKADGYVNKILIVGGTTVVSSRVETQLRDYAVTRVSGYNYCFPQRTAAEIDTETFAPTAKVSANVNLLN